MLRYAPLSIFPATAAAIVGAASASADDAATTTQRNVFKAS